MANEEHLRILEQGVEAWNQWRRQSWRLQQNLEATDFVGDSLIEQGIEAWNQWRRENPDIKPDLRGSDLRDANLSRVNLSGANLSGANLSRANLSDASLSDADLSNADLDSANLSNANLSNADLYNAQLSRANLYNADLSDTKLIAADLTNARLADANLITANLSGANLSGVSLATANLSGANLTNANLTDSNLGAADFTSANLTGTDLSFANLSNADFSGADLSSANLNTAQAVGTNFGGAILTGSCIQDWHINSGTLLGQIICEYIFTKYDWQKIRFTDRRPHDPNQIFAPGEFTKRYQIVLETVELFFHDGIDWKAFLASLQDLKTEYGDELNIQGIEKKAGGSFVVRLEVPSDADKGAVERDGKALYETKLQFLEARYHTELQAKDREIEIYRQQSADILELAKLAASRPIHVEAKAVADNQSRSETFNNTFNHSPIANFANQLNDQASQHATQNIGASLDEITTLIRSMRGIAESFPAAQRTEAIEQLEDLETDVQQPPEKRKLSRMKAALLALMGIAAAVSGAVTSTNEFVGQVQELSEKLGIPLPIEQVEPQEPIDVRADGSAQIKVEQPEQFQAAHKTPLEIFEDLGLVGCFEGDPDLSTNYKAIITDHLDEKHRQGRL